MIYAVLLAAGSGSRMKSSSVPKQFLELNGIPILKLTLDKFLSCREINKIIVVAPPIWTSHTKDILNSEKYRKISICEGGQSRQQSLYNGVKFISSTFKCNESDIVVSHDIARPFVTLRSIEENIEAMNSYDAVDTVICSTDTIVVSSDGKTVESIPNRNKMYQGQTPQTFRLKTFLEIYERLTKEYIDSTTDAARILKEHGCKVGLVRGDEFNIKITTDFDFNIATFLLSEYKNKDKH